MRCPGHWELQSTASLRLVGSIETQLRALDLGVVVEAHFSYSILFHRPNGLQPIYLSSIQEELSLRGNTLPRKCNKHVPTQKELVVSLKLQCCNAQLQGKALFGLQSHAFEAST